MSMTKNQVFSWNPSTLTQIGDAWIAMGKSIEGLFERYKSAVTTINGAHWEGKAAEAAQTRAGNDYKSAVKVVDHLERAANIAKNGFHEIDPHLQSARNAINAATGAGFSVSDDLKVSKSGELTAQQKTDMANHQRAITDAANATERADTNVKNALSAARNDLRVAFVAPAGLGSEQAGRDVRQLLDDPSKLSPEQLQRLIEAGSLPQSAIDALLAGDTATIPASQMEYMNALARSLDGKSPKEIEDIMNTIGKTNPAAKEGLANVLQLVSNDKVTASVRGDKEIPTDGGFNLLPSSIRDSLSRGDLAKVEYLRDPKGNIVKGTDGKPVIARVSLNGVGDNQSVARIAGAADDRLQSGSSLDKKLIDVGRQYLHAEVQRETAQTADMKGALFVDGENKTNSEGVRVTEDIFAAVGPDKIAVHEAVTGQNGQDFIKDIATHNWTDDGAAAKSLFQFNPGDQTISPGEGHTGQEIARRDGDIMEQVAKALSGDDARKLMLNIPNSEGGGTESVGERNPVLMRQWADSLSPYLSEMAGGPNRDDGFDVPAKSGDPNNWADPDNRHGGLTNIFSIIGSDTQAGDTFRGDALATILAEQGAYAHDPSAQGAAGHLSIAGILQGTMDQGLLTTLQDGNDDKPIKEKDIYDAKVRSWEAASKLIELGKEGVGKIPGGEYINLIYDQAGEDALKNTFVGQEPKGGAETAQVSAPNYAERNLQVLQGVAPELLTQYNKDPRGDYSWAFDNNGRFVDYDTALAQARNRAGLGPENVASVYQEMLNSLGNSGQGYAFRNAYEQVINQPTPKPR
ncbi:hypothetical protein [Mycobacteroides chelonae]|uniref:TPR repeat region-containing protein n=1 Tax=Mycobacteroides chelonae TaxID=1774 RepID=UPI003AABE436